MKLWILEPNERWAGKKEHPWSPWYDKQFCVVVRAGDEDAARKLAQSGAGDEDLDSGYASLSIWCDKAAVSCTELLPEGKEEVVVQDFRSA